MAVGQFRRLLHVGNFNGWRRRGALGLGQDIALFVDLVDQLLHERMVELALGGVEELLVLQKAIVPLLVLKGLHNHVEAIQILDELALGTLAMLVFLELR